MMVKYNDLNVVVIGGGGFIGTYLCTKLNRLGCNVIAIDPVFGDIQSDSAYKCVNSSTPDMFESSDIIIHLASIVGVHNVEHNATDTVSITYNTVNDILPYCDGVRKVMYASTSEVYGDRVGVMREGDSLVIGDITNVRSCYSIVKMLAENSIISNGGTVIRPFNFTGIGQDVDKGVIPKMINDAITTGYINVYGDGSQVRAFMDIDDAVSSILHILFKLNCSESIYNIGNPKNIISMADLAKIINTVVPNSKIRYIPFANVHEKSFDINYRVPDITRLGLSFNNDVDDIIHSVYNHLSNSGSYETY